MSHIIHQMKAGESRFIPSKQGASGSKASGFRSIASRLGYTVSTRTVIQDGVVGFHATLLERQPSRD